MTTETITLAERDQPRPAFYDAITVLVRNPGDMVHRRECRYAGRARTLPWLWAQDKTQADLGDAVANGLHMCKVCDPAGALPINPPA